MGHEYRTIYLSDTSAGNDKSFTVPTNRLWKLKAARCVLTASDTVGNREIQLTVASTDGTPYADVRAGAVFAASAVGYLMFFDGAARMTSVADTDWLSIQIPDMEIPPGHSIRLFDSANVDASSDSFDVRLVVEARGGMN